MPQKPCAWGEMIKIGPFVFTDITKLLKPPLISDPCTRVQITDPLEGPETSVPETYPRVTYLGGFNYGKYYCVKLRLVMFPLD